MIQQAQNRKTKIVATIGPATSSPDMIRQLIGAGMDVVRLNFSHGDYESHLEVIKEIRRACEEMGRHVAILQDLSGPKIRLGEIPGSGCLLQTGGEVTLASGKVMEGAVLPVNYPYLYEDVKVDNRILLADGQVELLVTGKADGRIFCRVIVGGQLSSHKGVNLPSSDLRIASFTEKDQRDLEFGLKADVDAVALSFVRHEKDLAPLNEIFAKMKRPPLLIAKIEKPQALDRLAEILKVVSGVMVARGDLGVEMPLEEVPLIQKKIIKDARRAGKVVITATQMLRSMMTSPRPSRAEVTDVANAVLDGTDAVMLSDETAVGQYPIEAVKVLHKVCTATEPSIDDMRFLREDISEILPQTGAAISRAACWLAHDIHAAAIMAATASGGTARLLARYRPPLPIVGLSAEPKTCRQLCLTWGVMPADIPKYSDVDEMMATARQWARDNGVAGRGDRLILTAGVPLGVPGSTNLLKVMEMDTAESDQ